jgi:tetratricopeptide (TPR) repeat protein
MKRNTIAVFLLVSAVFARAADKYTPPGGALVEELQWLAIQTACVGQYNNAQAGNYTLHDPRDNYTPADIRGYLTELSGSRTRTPTFYGICFDYAQAAYDDISAYRSHYEGKGMQKNGWYIAAAQDNSRQITLYDPVSRERATAVFNGVPLKESSRQNVAAHGGATWHAWLWVYGNNGTIYWIDPTWTDNSGYVWWGVVRNGREEQAYPLAGLCSVAVPNDVSFAYINSGDANKNKGEWDKAIAEYTEALRINPNNAAAYVNRGFAYISKGMYDRAIEDYNAALRIDPNHADSYNNRGWSYRNKGDYDRAIADYTQAIRLDPTNVNAYGNRGAVYGNIKKDYDRAIADHTQTIRLDPNNAVFYYNRGINYAKKQDQDRAIADYNQALRLNPNYVDAYYMRGLAYVLKNDYNRAILDLNAVLRINPNHTGAKEMLQTIREYRGY